MRPAAALTAVVCAGATAAAAAIPATAQAPQRITATPQTVDRAAIQTVHGRNRPVIELCSRTIRVSVRSVRASTRITIN